MPQLKTLCAATKTWSGRKEERKKERKKERKRKKKKERKKEKKNLPSNLYVHWSSRNMFWRI